MRHHNYHSLVVVDMRLLRKYNAIVQSGIPILKRYDLPGEWCRKFPRGDLSMVTLPSRAPHSPGLARRN